LGGGGAVEYADAFFCFIITFRTPLLQLPLYSQYQFFLYQNISKLRDKGLSYNKIAEWLNKKNYLSARGKILKGNHVYSILKKKQLKDEKLEREYPQVWSDFYLDIYDKSLIRSFKE
jgi:hypothetical protein